MAVLGNIVLHLLWQGAVAGLATAIAFRAAGPVASRVRYNLALIALVLIVMAPLATMSRQAGLLADWGLVASASPPGTAEPTPFVTVSDHVPGETTAHSTHPAGSAGSSAWHPVGPRSRSLSGDLLGWLGTIWLAGVGVFLMRLARGIVAVYRIRAQARPAAASLNGLTQQLDLLMGGRGGTTVLLSDGSDMPFAVGIRRPAVFLPGRLVSRLSSEQIRAVLAHELAHVRRRDYAVNLGQRVIEALLWFHPAVHWLSKVAREEREHCCDELAADVVGDRRVVAGALLALEEARGGLHALLPAAAGGTLLTRVERLLAVGPAGGFRWAPLAAIALLTGGGTMVLGTPARAPATVIREMGPEAQRLPTSPASRAPEAEARVVWTGELRPGERLRVRNIVGSIRVTRTAGSIGIVRARLIGARLPDLSFEAMRGMGGVTVCTLRAAHGRCDVEGYDWFGPPAEMRRARIDLTVELPPGVGVTAATFEGDLELHEVDSDAEARTGSGAIAARIVESPDRRSDRTYELHTGAGTVRVALPSGFGGELEARLSDGRVLAEAPLSLPASDSPRVRASLGPGGNRLRVSSGGGNLLLSRGTAQQ